MIYDIRIMSAKAAASADTHKRYDRIYPDYLALLSLIERLHRRLLDVIKDELDRRSRSDIDSVQALLLFNISDQEFTAGELRKRGYYLGSNISYALKKLLEMGFLDHHSLRVGRCRGTIKLSSKGRDVRDIVSALYEKHARVVEQVGGVSVDQFMGLNRALQRLDRFWTDQILYKL